METTEKMSSWLPFLPCPLTKDKFLAEKFVRCKENLSTN